MSEPEQLRLFDFNQWEHENLKETVIWYVGERESIRRAVEELIQGR